MALPTDYQEIVQTGDINAEPYRHLGEWLGDRPGWRFVKLAPQLGPGMWCFGSDEVARLEIRPWGGRYEMTVTYIRAGDDTQIFFDDFATLQTWVQDHGEAHVSL